MGDPSPVPDRIFALIKLTGKVVSLAYEHLWAADEIPKDLQALVDELQSLGKSLTGLKKASETEATKKFSPPVIEELNTPGGPLSECAAELKRLYFKLDSGSVRDRGEYMGGPSRSPGKIHILSHISRIEKHKNVFTLAIQIVNDRSKLSEAMVGYINVREDNNPQTRASPVAIKRKETLDWLYSGDFESRYLDLQEKRLKGTGEWILRSPIFQNWIKGKPGSLLLWGRAIAGAGKTYISSKIIDYIQTEAETRNYAVAYIFFDFMERDQQQPKHILSSLVKQLACQTRSFSRLCDTLLARLNTEQLDPTLEKLYTNLVETAKSFDRAFIVLDGFDDCDELTQRNGLLPIFHALAKGNISVFLTSKLIPGDIQRSLQSAAKIDLSAKDEDIKIYIEHTIDSIPRAKRLLKQSESRDKFVSELTACAGGMFLLVYLSMRSLCQQSSVKSLFDELQKLKLVNRREDRLQLAYARVIDSVNHQSQVFVGMAMRILTWLVKAQRTLTVDELRVAISVEADQYKLEKSSLPDNETMVDVCAGLVVIHERSNTVCLIHPTTKSRLLESLLLPTDSQIAIACLTYLSFGSFSRRILGFGGLGNDEDKLNEYPFFDYAAKYLSIHVNSINSCGSFPKMEALWRFAKTPNRACHYIMAQEDDVTFHDLDISPMVISSFVGILPEVRPSPGQEGPVLRAAVIGNRFGIVRLFVEKWRDQRGMTNIWKSDGANNSVLHLAARRGFTDIVRLLLDGPVGIDDPGKAQRTALQEAVLGGHEDVVNLLIENGASVWSRDECGQTALHIAAGKGHEGIVKELLKHCDDRSVGGGEFKTLAEEGVFRAGNNVVLGVGVMASDHEGRTPLHLAAWGSHMGVIRLLLAKGADVSVKDSTGGAALHLAVQGGEKSAVQLLLQHGSDVSVQDNDKVTALHRAAVRGYTGIVQILLDNGSDISATQWEGLTALSISVRYGFGEVVELLRDNGAQFPIPGEVDEMLSDAARNGYGDIVKILLNNGANFSDEAIYDAAANGHDNVVKIFLEEGADISLRHVDRLALLHVAAHNGHEDVVRLLLEHGADVHARDQFEQTPLHKAASSIRKFSPFRCVGSVDIVRLLLESGADISAEDDHRQTALALAADGGCEAVVQILIANGSDIANQDIHGNTALHRAARNGYTDTVKLLLDNGARISDLNQSRQTSLLLAATAGREGVVQLLLKSGADITDEDGDGNTLLHAAARYGNSDVVSLLIDNGADVAERDEEHRTALILAAEAGHHEVVAVILQNGGDISDKNKAGETALFLAARIDSRETLELLINEGVDIAEKNKEGETALFVASRAGAVKVVHLLLENGANISERNAAGETTLFLAGDGCHREVYELLIDNGADPLARDIHGRMASLKEEDYGCYDGDCGW